MENVILHEPQKVIRETGWNDGFHDHHHGDKYQSGFISKYIFSTDHKMISKQFLVTGIIWAVIGSPTRKLPRSIVPK